MGLYGTFILGAYSDSSSFITDAIYSSILDPLIARFLKPFFFLCILPLRLLYIFLEATPEGLIGGVFDPCDRIMSWLGIPSIILLEAILPLFSCLYAPTTCLCTSPLLL